MDITILGIESSCDDTSAAVLRGGTLLSNVIASQEVHRKYGGVIPELASRAHQQNIIPVVDAAIKEAGITFRDIDGIAFTRGPGLLGSLMVGVSFTKGLSLALDVPIMEVNHLHGHISAHFIDLPDRKLPHPTFPFLCLLVSGGHSQIVRVEDYDRMEIVGTTIDDAAGEAFDKCGKVMGLPYPSGPTHHCSGIPLRRIHSPRSSLRRSFRNRASAKRSHSSARIDRSQIACGSGRAMT